MDLSDEDKLILNSEMFYLLRTYLRQKKTSAEIIAKIDEVIKEGADVNACDSNDSNNTVLHIAAQKVEKDLVIYFLEKGAHLFQNNKGYTPAHLALHTNTLLGKEIANILSKEGKHAARVTSNDPNKQQTEQDTSRLGNSVIRSVSVQEIIYPKRAGTSGVSGQFYETKLLSLVTHRALHDKEIEEFYLAANMKDIGDFDDVCFRYGNVACFMQTKHRENIDKAKLTVASVRSSTGKLGLGIYYDSFLKIRQKFTPNSTDPMFKGKFEDIDCYFVLYTPLKESFDRKISLNKEMCSKMHDIIYTGEKEKNKNSKTMDIFQFDYEPQDLILLTKFINDEHMKVLGKTFLEFILSNNKLEVMMANELIKIYHPALAQKVIYKYKVLEPPENTKFKKPQNLSNGLDMPSYIYFGRFRPEFFDSEDYILMMLKDTFFKEIVYTHCSKASLSKKDIKQRIQNITTNPCAETISHLIGSPIKFDDANNKLILDINKLPKNKFKQDEIQQMRYDLQKIQVTRTIIKDAVYLVGKKKLEALNFQLPQTFGNIDLTTNQKSVDGHLSRLDFLASKFQSLINYFAKENAGKETKIIEISNEVVGPGKILEFSHLNTNGGIGGAVGNLLHFDIQNELFSFNTKGSLGANANYVLRKLKQLTNEDLNNYKINVNIDGFPRISFDTYVCDKNIAAEFLSKLWFYTNQAQEEAVEITIKREINEHYNSDKQQNQFLFRVHSDAIFLRFHDEIQKWWKKQTEAQYLTKSTIIFEKAKKDIVDSPLLTVLNVMYVRTIKNIAIEFDINAIDFLNLHELVCNTKNKCLNIISDAVILSAMKVMQYNKYQNIFTFINLDYVYFLPKSDYETMIEELKVLKDVTLVIINDAPFNRSLQDTLWNILNAYTHNTDTIRKQIIIITKEPLEMYTAQVFHYYDCTSLIDTRNSLMDLTINAQRVFLEKCKITYQGDDVNLNTIIDENSKVLINARLLHSLLNKEKMEIGQEIYNHKYHEIKNYYIDRNLKRNNEEYAIRTLDDVDDKVVLISSSPGMGKTTLLTHLSLETKKVDSKPWIVRINMSIHMKDFQELEHINLNKIMTFLSKAALKNLDNIKKVNFTAIDNERVSINSEDVNNISFELQLFIQFYNNGNVIFLFDGFDKICPHNTNEGLKLFTALKQANKRMWITSDLYVTKILERKFGPSYKLDRLSTVQQQSFLQRFWTTNLKLEKLNHEQCDNIIIFINYVIKTFNGKMITGDDNVSDRNLVPILSVPLHIIYLTVLEHFKNEANSLSSCYFREIIKKKWRLDSYTTVDRFLRSNEQESLELAGTPLHMYIAANYIAFQFTDKFTLDLDIPTIFERSNVLLSAVTLYERFLKVNIKNICDIENKSAVGVQQDKMRDDFFERHKKLAIYGICKECDIDKILTESEIRDAKETIKMIESGEIKTPLIDCVVDGVPRFYHLLFAEYFVVETLSDVLKHFSKGDYPNMKLDSLCNFLVNVVLVTGPQGLRNTFEYKLKYDPELTESLSNDNCTKIIFQLLSKQRKQGDENALNIAINEGLVNITNLLIKGIQQNLSSDSAECLKTIVKSSANIIAAIDTSRSILSEDALKCIENMDGETIIAMLNKQPVGNEFQEVINTKIVKPVKNLAQKLIEASGNNENLVNLIEKIPDHIPEYVRALFNK